MNLWRTFLDRLVLLPSKPATADWLSRQYYRFQINHTEEQSHNLFLMLNFFFPLLSLQGLYVFAVYFIMHNQLCWPTKASYTVEMSGQDGPDSMYQGMGPTPVGGDISKSTQNLISAMEEVHI